MRLFRKQRFTYFALDRRLVRRHKLVAGLVVGLQTFALATVIALNALSNQSAYAASYTWDGGGTTNNWSDCDNWSANICPTATDTVTFNATSAKNSTIDPPFGGAVTSVTIANTYAGTITQARSLTTSGTFSQSGGAFTGGSDTLDINGIFTLNSGAVFTAPSGELTAAAGFTIGSGAGFNHNNGNLVFDSSTAATIACNNASFNHVEFRHSALATKTVNSGCSLPLGTNPTIPGSITLSGALTGTGLLTQVGDEGTSLALITSPLITGFEAFDFSSTVYIIGAALNWSAIDSVTIDQLYPVSGSIIGPKNLVINEGLYINNSMSVNLSGTTTAHLNGTFTNSGTFTAPSGTLAVGVDHFTPATGAGTFNHNNGTVVLSGANQTLESSAAFFNLTKIANGPDTLQFKSGSTITVQGALTLQGADEDNRLQVISDQGGTAWNINAQGSRSLKYLSVKDSNNINASPMIAYDSEDLGNNTNWQFLASPTPESPVDNGNGSGSGQVDGLAETGSSMMAVLIFSGILLLGGAGIYMLRFVYDKMKV